MSAAAVFFWLDMSDETPTPEDIEDAVAADAEAGIASFSDGTNSVSMVPLKDRLEAAKIARRSSVSDPFATMRHKQLRSQGGGF